jgi:hypothetical protein
VTRARVQWSSNPDQLERGPMTGPLPVQAAESMARNLRRSHSPPAAVRVVGAHNNNNQTSNGDDMAASRGRGHYDAFIASKRRHTVEAGFNATLDAYNLFPFQADTVRWALSLGRAAIFADTGLGKTFMQLAWAREVASHTGRPVLLLAPLAVAEQTIREAGKFGIDGVHVVACADDVMPGVNVTNYDKLHRFDSDAFSGVVLDESSILKNAQGRTRNKIIAAFSQTPYRLACTATPAPNDYGELGNHAEFLGVMDEAIMKARWFINDLGDILAPWRLKKHAEKAFWRWVVSWARCIGKPSDMGDYSDDGYNLPQLIETVHHVDVDLTGGREDGMLFRVPDMSATAIHAEKRRTCEDRARKVAALVASEPDEPWVIWCDTNYDQDAVTALLPGAIDVRGNMTPEQKAAGLLRFSDEGGIVVTKPKIAGMGLNWQHSARTAFVGGSYSYEGYYQAIRRQWRFGQTREVHAHVVMAKTETALWYAIRRKAADHERMKEMMFRISKDAAVSHNASDPYRPHHSARIPAWLYTLETK